ncbi:hypothetical protein C7974DRAFT_456575 [Boeremia exigua]|uniref:uncharacterized protein n=1 Tax=Boeremia exigua TaxID=749465 RepID=UPI001E8CBE86|nr:uncharacterized protein C7974DRAFT_456575 [Boeremia exigua]KAH6621837.1 hypothetical protein C7974DRAFT_456575 [Boeremia exigua]
MCLKTDVAIDWRDVPSYFNTFFPTQDGVVANIDFAPERMTIYSNCYRQGEALTTPVEIDLLPILKLGLANMGFTCSFERCEIKGDTFEPGQELTTEEVQSLQSADVGTVQKLLAHRHWDWVKDVVEGRIKKLMVSQIGTNFFPQAKFHIGPGKAEVLPTEFANIKAKKARTRTEDETYALNALGQADPLSSQPEFGEYVQRVGLRAVFFANRYEFLWDHEWVQPE